MTGIVAEISFFSFAFSLSLSASGQHTAAESATIAQRKHLKQSELPADMQFMHKKALMIKCRFDILHQDLSTRLFRGPDL